MSLLKKDNIPYSEILAFLTNMQKRQFQSLNSTSKKLLLANIKHIYLHREYLQEHFYTYLNWLESNRRYLIGIQKIQIEIRKKDSETYAQFDTCLQRIFTVLVQLDYKNIISIRCDVAVSSSHRNVIQVFFTKISTVREVSISYPVLHLISSLKVFQYISNLEIIGHQEDSLHLERFLNNNHWKYLKTCKLYSFSESSLSCLFENILRDRAKLKLLFLSLTNIEKLPDPVQNYLKSVGTKSLKQLIVLDNSPEKMHLIQPFLTPYLEYLSIDRMCFDSLKYIATQCTSMRELILIDSEFSKTQFQTFLLSNQLKQLQFLESEYLAETPKKLTSLLPKLNSIVTSPFESLNTLSVLKLLHNAMNLESISLYTSFDIDIVSIIARLHQSTHLRSLKLSSFHFNQTQFHLLMNSLSLGQFKRIGLNGQNLYIADIAPYFYHLKQLEEIEIMFFFHDEIEDAYETIVSQITLFFDIFDSLDMTNKHLKKIDIIANVDNTPIRIPNHNQRFIKLVQKFPNIQKAQIGWGWFYFD